MNQRVRHSCVALALAIVLMPGRVAAFDLYSFFDSNCQRQTGVLAHVDAQRVVVVSLNGVPVAIQRSKIRSLVLHQVLENPLAEIQSNDKLRPLLRQVWTEKTRQPTFRGWVSGFNDDLVLFFDFNGKSHVLQAEEIVQIRPFRPPARMRIEQRRVPTLGFPRAIVPCGKPLRAAMNAAVMPSRVIADRIKIDDLLTALADRYRGFAGLEERTWVYARPYHYVPTLRLGLTYSQNSGFARYFPFYFNYTGGTPYRFQSRILIGSIVHDALPFMRRTLAASSDLKSHFFHATFVGQLPALPAESDCFLVDNGEVEPFTITTSYNYLILMGVDFWRFSASFGPAYLSFRVASEFGVDEDAVGFEFTATATSVTPVFRLQYRAERWSAHALYYRTRLTGVSLSSGASRVLDSSGLPNVDEVDGLVDSDVLRIGARASLPLRLTISVDQILSFVSAEGNQDNASADISYFQSETALMIGAEFGRYIAVRAFARLLLRSYEQRLEIYGTVDEATKSRFDPLFGGALEFVF